MSCSPSVLPTVLSVHRRDTYHWSLFSNVSDEQAQMAERSMDSLQAMAFMGVVMSILFTLLSVTFFMAVRYLIKDGLRRQSNKWMLGALTFMFACGAASYAFELINLDQSFKNTATSFTGRYDSSDPAAGVVATYGQYMIQGINVVCGDLIILWRTGVVWHDNATIRRLNLLFSVLIILTWIAGIAILATFGMQFLLIPLALSLTVNLWSTAVIGYKTWHRRRLLRQHVFMAGHSSASAVEGALTVITETGIDYTIIWIVYVAFIASFFFPSATSGESIEITLQRGFQWFWMIMNILIPLYPTLLILLIARHKAPLTDTLTSIDVRTAMPTTSTSNRPEIVVFQAVHDAIEKVGDEDYDPYVDITASSPGASSSSFPLTPNRRG